MACLVPSPEGIQQKKVCFAQRKARESSGETVEGDRGEQAAQSHVLWGRRAHLPGSWECQLTLNMHSFTSHSDACDAFTLMQLEFR